MPTMKYVTDGVFAPLSKRLKSLDVDALVKQAIEVATDEGREAMGHELDAEGAPKAIRSDIHVLRSPVGEGAVGLSPSSRAVEEALDWEFGSVDGRLSPHGTFRGVAADMSDIATAELAVRASIGITG